MKQKQIKLNPESGRSMVEMLGVLAVIGVLSITAVSGYRYAMNKHKANELWNDFMMLVQTMQAVPEYDNPFARTPSESYISIPSGNNEYNMKGLLNVSDNMLDESNNIIGKTAYSYGLFMIEINNVPKDVCEQFVQMKPDEMMLIVDTYFNVEVCESESMQVWYGMNPACANICQQRYREWKNECERDNTCKYGLSCDFLINKKNNGFTSMFCATTQYSLNNGLSYYSYDEI